MSMMPWTPFYDPFSNFGADFGGAVTPFGGFGGGMSTFGGMGDIDRYLKSMDRDMWRMKREMDRTFRNMDRSMERTFSPELSFMPSRPASMMEHYTLLNPIRVDTQGNRSLNVNFDLRSFKPEEINVTLSTKDRTINVEANHEVKDPNHYVKRSYSRKVLIPDPNIDLSKIELKSCLTNEGVLCVEAPLPRLSIEEAARPQPGTALTTEQQSSIPIKVKTV